MAKSRKDKKGRVLNPGEYQRKDGTYEYRFTHKKKRYSIYSSRLVESDPVPRGKKKTPALRTMVKKILRDKMNDVPYEGSLSTLNDLFNRYIEINKGLLKDNSISVYTASFKVANKYGLGDCLISKITTSQIKELYRKLFVDDHYSENTVKAVHTTLKNCFSLAQSDRLISYNPCDDLSAFLNKLTEIQGDGRREQTSLTLAQERIFLDEVKRSRSYSYLYDTIVVMINTGMRIGELAGLQIQDCDFKNKEIIIRHNLVSYYDHDQKGICHKITTPKTKKGKRTIPMMTLVEKSLLSQIERVKEYEVNPEYDDFNSFIFMTNRGQFIQSEFLNRAFKSIVSAYNKRERGDADKQHRDPIFLPHITTRTLRRTFATRLNDYDVDFKVRQMLLGHSNIQVTINTYTDVHEDQYKNKVSILEKQLKKDRLEYLHTDHQRAFARG